jgi:hypothetical protein
LRGPIVTSPFPFRRLAEGGNVSHKSACSHYPKSLTLAPYRCFFQPLQDGVASLIVAAMRGHEPFVRLLIEHKANINSAEQVLLALHGHAGSRTFSPGDQPSWSLQLPALPSTLAYTSLPCFRTCPFAKSPSLSLPSQACKISHTIDHASHRCFLQTGRTGARAS